MDETTKYARILAQVHSVAAEVRKAQCTLVESEE